jgi:hypothetical protein
MRRSSLWRKVMGKRYSERYKRDYKIKREQFESLITKYESITGKQKEEPEKSSQ